MRKIYLLFFAFIAFVQGFAQTNPASQSVPYSQDFAGLTGATPVYPAGIQGWTISGSTSTSYPTAAPNGDQAIVVATNGTTTAHVGDYTGKIGFLNTGSAIKAIGLSLNTTGVSNVQVSYVAATQRQEATARIGAMGLQYRVGTTGAFTNVAGSEYQNPGGTTTITGTGGTNPQTITVTLPAAANNQAVVEVRWVYREVSGSGNRPGFSIDDIAVTGGGAVVNTVSTGSVATAPFCIDPSTPGTGTVAYTSTGTYNTTFTAYLSDASGSFTTPVNIGSTSVNGTDPSGNINITIPSSTPSGSGYRIRVDAATPAVTGTAGSAFEIINGAREVTNVTAAPGNQQAVVNWTNPFTCFDEVLIVAKAGASITGSPTGDGTAYTASNTFGSGTAFNGGFVVYKGITPPQTITNLVNGTTYYVKVFSRRGTNWSNGVEVTVTANLQPGPGDIVINQFSPDYGGSSDEFIELVNKTNNTYDLAGLAIRYQAASGGSGGAGGTLSGSLQSKRFWLLSPNTTITVGMTNGLSRDGAITSGFAANGQLALVRISDNVVIDAVGYGTLTGGTYTETAAAPAPPADGAIRRITDGADTDNNSVDFATVATADIFLRNSASAPLPVRFTNIKALQKGNSIEVAWSNSTEENVVTYAIERSSNGRSFGHIGQLTAKANNGGKADYSFIDATPVNGDNFYRIKAVETSGKTIYSNIVRMNTAKKGTELLVYPNPVKGAELNLQLSNLPVGKYTIKVISINGQELDSRLMNHAGGNVSETITLKNLKPGVYTLVLNGSISLNKTFLAE